MNILQVLTERIGSLIGIKNEHLTILTDKIKRQAFFNYNCSFYNIWDVDNSDWQSFVVFVYISPLLKSIRVKDKPVVKTHHCIKVINNVSCHTS